jgi:hypothetical protein
VWQPSRFDTAVISSGTAVVDAVGQHAGTLQIAWKGPDVAALNVTAGWIGVAGAVNVGGGGVGTVNHSGGKVAANSISVGGGISGSYNLSGSGWLRAGTLSKAANGSFNFTGGVLSADVVEFDLLDQGGVISPGASAGQTHIEGSLVIDSGSILIELGGDASGQFDKIIIDGMLTAGGTFAVSLIDGFSPGAGDVFDVLDFASATGTFQFQLPALGAGLVWNTSALLTTGELAVTQASLNNADFNGDGSVDGADYLIWQRGLGLSGQTNRSTGDANGDGVVDIVDLTVWQSRFGEFANDTATAVVPEPSVYFFAIGTALSWVVARRAASQRAK